MKNILEKCKTYMIGAMEFQNGEGWRNKCSKELEEKGIICYDPYKKPFDEDYVKEDQDTQEKIKLLRENGELEEVHKHFKEIIAIDLAMVDRSDFIICYINPSTPTFGTMHELIVANQAKKPIFIFVEGGKTKTPLWLLGLLPVRFFYDDLDSLLDMVKKIDDGTVEIDSKRWRLFKKHYR
tara:strand:- start:816 stop:1358 length:543 start_codon:yes stop_codon:yes gene_type:complete